MSLEAEWEQADKDGVTMKAALVDIGYLGTTPCHYRANKIQCHLELHIEQGPLLEKVGKTVGVVMSVQAMKWFCVRITGTEGHTGTMAMADRWDALVTASRFITAVRDTAKKTGLGVATVGVINSDSSSMCIIPGGVNFIIDIRCSTDAMVEQLSSAIFAEFDDITTQESNGTAYTITKSWGLPEAKFHTNCIDAMRNGALAEVPESLIMDMKSRAGHDSAWTSQFCPTSMIFVPSKDGLSHNPNEYSSPEHCALGAQVLLNAILNYDERVKSGEFC
jgi:hydantoinase/carbamoylase family amidase